MGNNFTKPELFLLMPFNVGNKKKQFQNNNYNRITNKKFNCKAGWEKLNVSIQIEMKKNMKIT